MAVDHNNPQSRNEEILIATIDGNEYNKAPQSRMEELLLELKETIEEGGGGGGTSDYESLSNQPQVNGETLIGNKTGADLGLVDSVEGKGLSTNDYDNDEKAAVAAATSAISAMKDGTDLDSFGDVEVALLDKADTSDLGTAAAKDSTNSVTAGSTDLVESGAVKDAIDVAVAAAYHHAGTKTVAQLTHDLLIAANEGNVYNITDSGTTTSDFIEGIGKTIDEGSNVGICKVGNTYMFDLLSGFVDTSNFIQKSVTAGLLKNDGTVNDEIEGDVSTLKSGLTNLDVALSVPENSGKNELPTTLDWLKASNTVGTWYGNVYTKDNVTFTVATDSKGRISSITVNGTASGANTIITLASGRYDEWSGMILNGAPTNNSDYYIRLEKDGSPYTAYAINIGGDTTISSEIVGNDIKIFIKVGQGKTANNAVFTPMIRDSRITDPTFAPYIPSVESRIEGLESHSNKVLASTTSDGVKTYAQLLEELRSSVIDGCMLSVDKFLYQQMSDGRFCNVIVSASSGNVIIQNILLSTNGNIWYKMTLSTSGNSIENVSASVPARGSVFKITRYM